MGIVSDFDERLEKIVRGLGISSYFRFIVQGYVEGYGKPSDELWKKVVERVGTIGPNGWHVGDDPKKDAFTDANVVILDRNNSIFTDLTKITSLKDLPKLLKIS